MSKRKKQKTKRTKCISKSKSLRTNLGLFTFYYVHRGEWRMPISMSIFITIVVGALSFRIGVCITNDEWTRKLDYITQEMIDKTEEELMKIYEKDKVGKER